MNKKIYVVEDNDDIREMIGYMFMDTSYSFSGFPNATSFLSELDAATPDLIILDIMLPDGNGLEICKKLKINLDTCDIPVILMSAHASQKQIEESECAEEFIAKPFNVNEFIGSVEKYLA